MDISLTVVRIVEGHWVYRHWYGSGHAVVVQTYFASAEDAVNDDPWGAFSKKWQAASEERQKRLGELGQKYASFLFLYFHPYH